jgi:hypothetical protein
MSGHSYLHCTTGIPPHGVDNADHGVRKNIQNDQPRIQQRNQINGSLHKKYDLVSLFRTAFDLSFSRTSSCLEHSDPASINDNWSCCALFVPIATQRLGRHVSTQNAIVRTRCLRMENLEEIDNFGINCNGFQKNTERNLDIKILISKWLERY